MKNPLNSDARADKILMIVGFLLAGACIDSWTQEQQVLAGHGLELILQAAKVASAPCEPVILTVTVQNNGQNTCAFNCIDSPDTIGVHFDVLYWKPGMIDPSEYMPIYSRSTQPRRNLLAPGEKYSIWSTLLSSEGKFLLDSPGKHQFQVRLGGIFEVNSGSDDLFEIISNEVEVEVVEPYGDTARALSLWRSAFGNPVNYDLDVCGQTKSWQENQLPPPPARSRFEFLVTNAAARFEAFATIRERYPDTVYGVYSRSYKAILDGSHLGTIDTARQLESIWKAQPDSPIIHLVLRALADNYSRLGLYDKVVAILEILKNMRIDTHTDVQIKSLYEGYAEILKSRK